MPNSEFEGKLPFSFSNLPYVEPPPECPMSYYCREILKQREPDGTFVLHGPTKTLEQLEANLELLGPLVQTALEHSRETWECHHLNRDMCGLRPLYLRGISGQDGWTKTNSG